MVLVRVGGPGTQANLQRTPSAEPVCPHCGTERCRPTPREAPLREAPPSRYHNDASHAAISSASCWVMPATGPPE